MKNSKSLKVAGRFLELKVALVGAHGFVGSKVCKVLQQESEIEVDYYIRGQIINPLNVKYDLVINASNPAKRYWANLKPELDFRETFVKTIDMLNRFASSRMMLVSSLSCRTQEFTPYGAHRLLAENLVLDAGGTVIRLGPMFGGKRDNSVLHDICNSRPVYVAKDSRYGYVDVELAAKHIVQNLQHFKGVNEFTSKNYIKLSEIAEYVRSGSIFSGENDDQYNLDCHEGPDAYDVLKSLPPR